VEIFDDKQFLHAAEKKGCGEQMNGTLGRAWMQSDECSMG